MADNERNLDERAMALDVTFWGVRGSTACASPAYEKYGGHTSCVSVSDGHHLMICDAGTGLYDLGGDVVKKGIKEATLLLSHAHFDHVIGFPFFAPLWQGDFILNIHSGHFHANGSTVTDFFAGHLFCHPFFPVSLDLIPSTLRLTDHPMGATFHPFADVKVQTVSLFHPGGACGYVIEWAGRRVCYLSDTEHQEGATNNTLMAAMAGADLVIYDATYTEGEFASKKGWGHSTWQEGLRLAQRAGAREIAFFHHDPSHTDDMLDTIAADAKAASLAMDRPIKTTVARQGLTVSL